MKFMVKSGRGYADEKIVYNDKVIGRKLNGWIVEHDGEECFIPSDEINVISISDEEKNLPIRW